MLSILTLAAATILAVEDTPPAAARDFLAAIGASDLAAARSKLAPDALIMDESDGSQTSVERFAEAVRGCRQSEIYWDVDQEDASRAATTVFWTCPSRPGVQAFIWTDPSGIVHLQFGPAPAP